MSRNIPPPFCYVCKSDFESSLDKLHYCICDTAVCNNCLNSIKKNENQWICPKCKTVNEIMESALFRDRS